MPSLDDIRKLPAATPAAGDLFPFLDVSAVGLNPIRQATIEELVAVGMPDQTGHAGEVLTTDGTTASWTSEITLDALTLVDTSEVTLPDGSLGLDADGNLVKHDGETEGGIKVVDYNTINTYKVIAASVVDDASVLLEMGRFKIRASENVANAKFLLSGQVRVMSLGQAYAGAGVAVGIHIDGTSDTDPVARGMYRSLTANGSAPALFNSVLNFFAVVQLVNPSGSIMQIRNSTDTAYALALTDDRFSSAGALEAHTNAAMTQDTSSGGDSLFNQDVEIILSLRVAVDAAFTTGTFKAVATNMKFLPFTP